MLPGGFWNDTRDNSTPPMQFLSSLTPHPRPSVPRTSTKAAAWIRSILVLSSGTAEVWDGNGSTDFGDILAVLSEWGVCSEGEPTNSVQRKCPAIGRGDCLQNQRGQLQTTAEAGETEQCNRTGAGTTV